MDFTRAWVITHGALWWTGVQKAIEEQYKDYKEEKS